MEDQVFLWGLDYRGRQNRGGTVCVLQDEGWECASKQLCPPPIFAHNNTTPPFASRSPWWGGPRRNKHIMLLVLVDVWLFFLGKKVIFMAELHRKYVYISSVALVETMFLWVSFSVIWWHRVT